jgi:hypothetical protein
VSDENSDLAEDQSKAGGKRQRAELRQRAAKQRELKTKLIRGGAIFLVAVIPALWWIDHSGSEEIVDAVVTGTQRYQHVNEISGPHTHIRATLLIDDRAEEVIQRADNYVRGQHLDVWIRRGPITGYPYFYDIVKDGELMSSESES